MIVSGPYKISEWKTGHWLHLTPNKDYGLPAHAARPELEAPLLAELAALDDTAFRKRFAGTAIKRIGRDRLVRNVAYALGNSGKRETAVEMPTGSFILIPALTQHYVFAKGVTITQVHGIGPSGIAYNNPADDPRK